MKVRGLVINDAKDGVKWRAVMGSKRQTPTTVGKNGLKMFVIVVVI